jgi:hypothetical protein
LAALPIKPRRRKSVGAAQAFLGDVVSVLFFVMLAAGMMKVFQMAGDVREMKDLLKDIKRNTGQVPAPVSAAAPMASATPTLPSAPISAPMSTPAPPMPTMTPEELVRAVHAQKFTDDDFDVMEPVFPPRQ